MIIRTTICASLLMLAPAFLPAQTPAGAGGPAAAPSAVPLAAVPVAVPAPVAAAPAPAAAVPTSPPAAAAAKAARPAGSKQMEAEAAARELIGKAPSSPGVGGPMLETLIAQMGWLAYPFAILSLITMSLIFLQLFTLHRRAVASDKFMNMADNLIRNRDFLGLLTFCNRRNEMIAHVTRKAIDFATRNPTARFEEVRDVAEAEGNRQSNLLMQRVSYLADIGSVAPLLGLMGTVIGLISSFNAIASENYTGAQQVAVARGVGQALITTASGLAIAIPAVLFYAMFRARANTLVTELESACTHIMAVLAAQYERPAVRPRKPTA